MAESFKIKRYGITCPFQKFLVAKYENVIKWNEDRITSPEALNEHIREKMLPALKRRMEPGDPHSHYCCRIDLNRILQNPAQHFNEVRAIHSSQGERAARKFLLDRINRQKKEVFDAWWLHMTQGHAACKAHPAFQYLVLRPVLDTSDDKCTREPIPLNAEAVNFLFDGIQNNALHPQLNLISVMAEFAAFGRFAPGQRPYFGTNCGWIRVTSDTPYAAERVATLARGSGWCVESTDMAGFYLHEVETDFSILMENGRAVAAVRTCCHSNDVVEIQGRHNASPKDWWPRIILYIQARELDILYRKDEASECIREYREKGGVKRTPKQLAKYLKNMPAAVLFIADEYLEDVLYHPVIKNAWLACIVTDPQCINLAPPWVLDGDAVRNIRITGIVRHLLRDPVTAWNECPPDFQALPDIQAARKDGWAANIRRDPHAFERCPVDLKHDLQDILLPAIKRAVTKKPTSRKERERKIPFDRLLPAEQYEDRTIALLRLIHHILGNTTGCFEESQVPDDISGRTDYPSIREEAWREAVAAQPPFFAAVPGDLVHAPGMQPAHVKGKRVDVDAWIERVKAKPWILEQRASVPKSIRHSEALFHAYLAGWSAILSKNPTRIWKRFSFGRRVYMSYAVLNHPFIIKALAVGWARRMCDKRYARTWESTSLRTRFLPAIQLSVLAALDHERYRSSFAHVIEDIDSLSDVRDAVASTAIQNEIDYYIRRLRVKHEIQLRDHLTHTQSGHAYKRGSVLLPIPEPDHLAINLVEVDWDQAAPAIQYHVKRILNQMPAIFDISSESVRASPELQQFVLNSSRRQLTALMGDVRNLPRFVMDDPQFRSEVSAFWNTANLMFSQWMRIPEFLKNDSPVIERALEPITRALHYNPSSWDLLISPWRERQDLRHEAAQLWAFSPLCKDRPIPDDLRDLVTELKQNTSSADAAVDRWVKILRRDIHRFPECPEAVRKAAPIRALAIEAWAKTLEQQPARFEACPEEIRAGGRIAEARIGGWMNILRERPGEYGHVPPEVLGHPLFVHELKKLWAERIAVDVHAYDACPAVLKDDPAILRAVTTGWLDHIQRNPDAAIVIPPSVGKHLAHVREWIQGWSDRIEQNIDRYAECPKELRQTKAIRDALVRGWSRIIANNPKRYATCPVSLKSSPAIAAARISGWAGVLEQHPEAYPRCPPSVRHHPRIAKAHEAGWAWKIMMQPADYAQCPASLRHSHSVLGARFNTWFNAVKQNLEAFEKCPDDLRGNEDFLKAVKALWVQRITEWPRDYALCPPEFRQSIEIVHARKKGWQSIIESNPLQYQNCPAELRTKSMVKFWRNSWIAHINHNPENHSSCPEELRNDIGILKARQSGWIRRILDNPLAYAARPDELRDAHELSAAEKDGWSLRSRNKQAWADRRDGWVKYFAVYPERYSSCPEDLKKNVRIFASWLARAADPDVDGPMAHAPKEPSVQLITKALRRDPQIWIQVISPWREMPRLKEEAARNWVNHPSCEGMDPPDDIIKLVTKMKSMRDKKHEG